jgi:tRNA-splicing ligase RtcB (3'-phosphate/5'-hydroxy nucleic acid ligase)
LAEHAAEYEWRGEGDEAEIVLYAADDSALEHALPAARLPGVEGPVYAAASLEGFGWAAASTTHLAPDLISAPVRGLLLVAGTRSDNLGVSPQELKDRALRELPEAGLRLPSLNESGVGRFCESGAHGAAEDGLIEEEDLPFLGVRPGDADAVGRRALATGQRAWESGVEPALRLVTEVLDTEGAESLGLEEGALALVVRADAGDLGRLALEAHRERILSRVRSGDFVVAPELPAAPGESGEAEDLAAALHAAANFADARAARALWMLRRVLGGAVGGLEIGAAWGVGGIEERGGRLVHRRDLASAKDGHVLVCGGYAAAGTGNMRASAPPFGVPEEEGRWPWEEAGLLERRTTLDPPEGRGWTC